MDAHRRSRGSSTPGALHEGRPWRAVTHIDERTGARGARIWRLSLACGHVAFRRVPNPPLKIAIADSAANRRIMRGAPRHVRCLWCPPDANGDAP